MNDEMVRQITIVANALWEKKNENCFYYPRITHDNVEIVLEAIVQWALLVEKDNAVQ